MAFFSYMVYRVSELYSEEGRNQVGAAVGASFAMFIDGLHKKDIGKTMKEYIRFYM
jgi:hypothetical protein